MHFIGLSVFSKESDLKEFFIFLGLWQGAIKINIFKLIKFDNDYISTFESVCVLSVFKTSKIFRGKKMNFRNEKLTKQICISLNKIN